MVNRLSFLAGFTEESGAGGVDGPGDRVSATRAGFALPAVDGEIEREVTGVAVGVEKIAQGGATGIDTFSQHVSHLCQ